MISEDLQTEAGMGQNQTQEKQQPRGAQAKSIIQNYTRKTRVQGHMGNLPLREGPL